MIIMKKKKNILKEIQATKNRLNKLVEKKDRLIDKEIIELSQYLDGLLNEYVREKRTEEDIK